jgi:hypothetical protein
MSQLLIDGSCRLSKVERQAVRRALKLANDYLLANVSDDRLVAARGGMMTWGEIRQHLNAAQSLLNPRRMESTQTRARDAEKKQAILTEGNKPK